MTRLIRPAVAGGQEAILARGERANPNGWHWPNFVVAERAGGLVSAIQIKLRRDARESWSRALVP